MIARRRPLGGVITKSEPRSLVYMRAVREGY